MLLRWLAQGSAATDPRQEVGGPAISCCQRLPGLPSPFCLRVWAAERHRPAAATDPLAPSSAVADVHVMTLGRPPSAKPALDIANRLATGRVVRGGGEYEPYEFLVKTLSTADWNSLQSTICREFSQYPAGAVTYIRDAGPAKLGGQIGVTVHAGGVSTGLSLDSDKASADPVVITLRSLAVKYFGAATF